MTTIAILDDHPLFRDGLRNLLVAEGLPVVAESANIAGVDALLAASPDLVIIDLGLPDGDGLDVVRRIRTTTPRTRVLVLSMASDAATVARALGAGAHGFLTKDSTPSEVVSAIRAVAAGVGRRRVSVAGRLHGLADHAAYTPTERDFPRLTAKNARYSGSSPTDSPTPRWPLNSAYREAPRQATSRVPRCPPCTPATGTHSARSSATPPATGNDRGGWDMSTEALPTRFQLSRCWQSTPGRA